MITNKATTIENCVDFETLKMMFIGDTNKPLYKSNLIQIEDCISDITKIELGELLDKYNLSDVVYDYDFENYIITRNKIITMNIEDIFGMIREGIKNNECIDITLDEMIRQYTELRFLNYVEVRNILNLKMTKIIGSTLRLV